MCNTFFIWRKIYIKRGLGFSPPRDRVHQQMRALSWKVPSTCVTQTDILHHLAPLSITIEEVGEKDKERVNSIPRLLLSAFRWSRVQFEASLTMQIYSISSWKDFMLYYQHPKQHLWETFSTWILMLHNV